MRNVAPAALQVIQRDRVRQVERSAACPPQRFEARAGPDLLAERMRERPNVEPRRARQRDSR